MLRCRLALYSLSFTALTGEVEGSDGTALGKGVVFFVSSFFDGWKLRVELVVDSGSTLGQAKRWSLLF